MKTIFRKTALLPTLTLIVSMISFDALAADLIVYPAKGQSESKMNKDKSECHQWAIKETGIDPSTAEPAAAPANSPQPTGERLRGGARGAAGGAAIGAVEGNAGKGAAIGAIAGEMAGARRARMERREEKTEAQQAQAQTQQQHTDTFNRAYAACLEGRGYTVK